MKQNRNAFRGGAYSLILSAVVLTILIVINILVNALPDHLTKYDISAAKLYSVTSNTKAVISGLDQDVTIYWIVQADKEDAVIENLLNKYDSLSDHIQIVKKNPDVYPTFAQQYTDETVANNSLVVESGERSRFIGYDDIYVQEADVYSYSYSTSFDGEGAVTSAVDYVVNEEQPIVYLLEGHGERELSSSFKDQVEKENIQLEQLSLLNVDSIPGDAAAIMIYAPSSDLSEEETAMLEAYTKNGGKLFAAAGPVKEGNLDNLHSLLAEYGVTAEEGIVIEGDREHYALQTPYALLPEMHSSDLTDSLIEEHYYPILPIVQGLKIDETAADGRVTPLLSSTGEAYSKKAGYDLSVYEREEGDTDGPFAAALSISCENDGRIIWFGSSDFLEDMYNALSSGANGDLGMNALSAMIGESEAMAIRSKSLNYNYLTISESESAMLQALMIGVLPLAYLGAGICVVMRRRRMQNEAG